MEVAVETAAGIWQDCIRIVTATTDNSKGGRRSSRRYWINPHYTTSLEWQGPKSPSLPPPSCPVPFRTLCCYSQGPIMVLHTEGCLLLPCQQGNLLLGSSLSAYPHCCPARGNKGLKLKNGKGESSSEVLP